jgi:Uma2 family endonuclease
MAEAAKQLEDLYPQLEALPENMVGEIINGRLIASPRPSGRHGVVSSGLGSDLLIPYQRGRGGPGGWWIIDEPEIHFIRDTEVLVPDIAGWRKERMPYPPEGHRFEIVPDWVCEILSPGNARRDRAEKMPLYAQYGVQWLWLADPLTRILETYELTDGHWLNLANYKDDDRVCAPPFDAIEIELGEIWPPEAPAEDAQAQEPQST